MTIEPHTHRIPPRLDVGILVRFIFASDVAPIHSQQYCVAHAASIHHESFLKELSDIDLRGREYGAIVTKIHGAGERPTVDLTVFADAGTILHLEGVCHVLESETSCYCALPCRNTSNQECSYPNFCNPQPDSPPPVIPCPVTDDVRCRWQQAKVGRWFLPEEMETGLPKHP